ncbi:MAG: DUF4345 domain-containing protein [Acidobacteria bacterium]|nr:DUF4345 domain-containing protein [Acidobacteriota bacterium]
MEIANYIILFVSGMILTGAGAMRVVKPAGSYCLQSYLGKPGVKLEDDVDMLSEMRGAGALTLLTGLIALAGLASPRVMPASFAAAGLIFLGFGLGRVISLAVDGRPNRDLINGTIAELVFGTLNIGCLAILLT